MRSLFITVVVFSIVFCIPSSAAIIHVPGDYPTIQAGINAASNGDTVLVADGVYNEHIDFVGKQILVKSENGFSSSVINGVTSGTPVVQFTTNENQQSILDGFEISSSTDAPGIYVQNSGPQIIYNLIDGNSNSLQLSDEGGGIYCYNFDGVIRNNIISNNIAGSGAGVCIWNSTMAIIDSNIVSDNYSSFWGAGIRLRLSNNCVVSHNIIYDNYAGTGTGGINISEADNSQIINNTMDNNESPGYGAIAIWYSHDANLVNNIVTNTIGTSGIFMGGTSSGYVTYCNSFGNSGGNYEGISPGAGCISLDPLFVGGDPCDYNLQTGSPCIDTGDPNSPLDPDGTIADMGALYNHHLPQPGQIIHVPGDYPTIQAGINAAYNGDTVLVADGTYNENINFSGKRILVKSENGAISTIIQSAINDSPVVLFDSNESLDAVLEGFTILGAVSAPGIEIDNASPTIINNEITNNQGGGISGEGGGISCYISSAIIRRNVIKNNSAVTGGGIAVLNSNGVVIDSNIVEANYSSEWVGGIRIRLTEGVIVSHNIIINNQTVNGINGLQLSESDSGVIINNTIDNNHGGPQFGSLTIWYSDNVNIYNTIVTNDPSTHGIGSYNSSNLNVTYCNSYGNSGGNYEGFTPGTGSISLDPMFVGGDPFDYHLQAGSPCIDAGDPNSPLDPDGSIADMGALYSGDIVTGFGFDIADVHGENSLQVSVPIYAYGLGDQDIAGAEFHIGFDNACLQYDSISSDYFAGMLVNVVANEIHILWEDYTDPIVLPESTTAIELQFTVLGQLGDTCSIEWMANNEIVDSLGNVVPGLNLTDGEVRIIEFHRINGRVVYYDMLTPLQDIDMELGGDWTASEVTDQNGFYQFDNLFPGDFIICPQRDVDDPGVTVGDIVKIRRHLVLLEPFDSPYKFVAADVNASDYVSVADVIKIRRYLAGLEPLPSGNWAFVDSSYAITGENWMDAPDCLEFTIWDLDLADSSFIGIRMGDVDLVNGLSNVGGGPLITDIAVLDLEDVMSSPDDTVAMPLTVEGFNNVAGIEIHIEYPQDRLEFLNVSSTVISDYTYNYANGEFHLIWEDIDNTITLPDNSTLFEIEFSVIETVPGQIPVTFLSAYVVDIAGMDFVVDARNGQVVLVPSSAGDDPQIPAEYGLRQNYPNPFNARTRINYQLPKSSHVKFDIFDLLGRKIGTVLDQQMEAGYHSVDWDAAEYPSGIYFYVMKAGEFEKSFKMLLLK